MKTLYFGSLTYTQELETVLTHDERLPAAVCLDLLWRVVIGFVVLDRESQFREQEVNPMTTHTKLREYWRDA